jgi:hypothetical protein
MKKINRIAAIITKDKLFRYDGIITWMNENNKEFGFLRQGHTWNDEDIKRGTREWYCDTDFYDIITLE